MYNTPKDVVKNLTGRSQIENDNNYFPISPLVLNPEVLTDFRVYLRLNDRFVLYTREKQRFTQILKDRLVDNGIETVYVPYDQEELYDQHVFDNLGDILNNNEIETDVRSQVFLETSSKHVREIFD